MEQATNSFDCHDCGETLWSYPNDTVKCTNCGAEYVVRDGEEKITKRMDMNDNWRPHFKTDKYKMSQLRTEIRDILNEVDEFTPNDQGVQGWIDAKDRQPLKAVIVKSNKNNEKPTTKDGVVANGWTKVGSPVTINNENQLAELEKKRADMSKDDENNQYKIARVTA